MKTAKFSHNCVKCNVRLRNVHVSPCKPELIVEEHHPT